jgi:hypothetical protein
MHTCRPWLAAVRAAPELEPVLAIHATAENLLDYLGPETGRYRASGIEKTVRGNCNGLLASKMLARLRS